MFIDDCSMMDGDRRCSSLFCIFQTCYWTSPACLSPPTSWSTKKFKKKSRFETDRQFVSDIKGRKIATTATTTTGKMTKLLLLSFFLSAILVLDSISARIAPLGLEELESNDIEEVKRDDGVFDATALVRFKNISKH